MNRKLLLQDLVDQLAEAGNIKKKEAEEFLREFFKASEDALFRGESVKISSLGTFKLIKVDARKSVNVATGEEIEIKEHYKLSFIPDTDLKEIVNKPYSHLEPVELDTVLETDASVRKEHKTPSNKHLQVVDNNVKSTESKPEDSRSQPKSEVSFEPKMDVTMKKAKGTLWLWVIFFSVLTVLGIWSYLSNEAQKREDSLKMKDMELLDSLQAETRPDTLRQTVRDSLRALVQDSAAIESSPKQADAISAKPEKTTPIKEVVAKPAIQAKSKPSTKDLATLVVKPGQRLTWISKKYYGHKAFWVYIYEANKDIIKDPNVLPLGATLHIPQPDPGKIDANNPVLIDKAKALQYKILEP
jgi:nucleoid DNA-binding protein/nucleoid-associated protein YgaU